MMSDNASIVDDRKLDNASKSLLSRLRTFHRLNKTMKEGLPLVSKELVEWMADNDNATVPLKDVATQIAKLTEWRQERIVFSNEGLPVFTGKMLKPKSGATVKATELITAMTTQMGTSAKATAKALTDNNTGFWAPFAGPALADEIMRQSSSFKGANTTDINTALAKVIPKTKSDYLTFLKGGTYDNFGGTTTTVPPSPGYIDARASVAQGLVLALPDDAYSTSSTTKTLNSETNLSGKASVFLVNYMLTIMYPVDRAQGMLSTDNTTGMVLPQIENFKQLQFTSDPSVSEIAGAIMGVTAPTDNDTHAYTETQMRAGSLMDLSSLQLAEFREFDAEAMGIEASDTANIECSVKFYDESTSSFTNLESSSNGSITILKVDSSTGEFESSGISASITSSGTTRTVSNAAALPVNQEYALRFKMGNYTNDLPDVFFYVDGFEATMNVCGPEGYVIGPDMEDKPVPGMGLMAGSSKTDAEGLDFSNFTEPGALTLLFPSDESGGKGTRDLMLTKSSDGNTFTLLTGDNMSLDLQSESGIHSLMGQSLTDNVKDFEAEDITICASGCKITPGTYGGLSDKLAILKVSDSEYWLLEFRFLDTTMGFMDLGFAKINAQGRAEFPDAGFEQGPVDMAKANVIHHTHLMFGEGFKLSDNTMQFPFDMQGNVNSNMGSDFRYSGKYFKQKISQMSDMDDNNFWQDASSIPVRIDGTSKDSVSGEVNIRFRKFTYKKSTRTYEVDNSSSTSVKDLEHNDLLAVFTDCTETADSTGSGCDPTHLIRVVRFDTTSLQANMGIELEIAKMEDNPSDERNNVVQFLSSTVSASDKYPGFSMNDQTIGYVYDGDYDGVPYIMDPNDDDPNQPGSGGGPGGGPAGDGVMMEGTFGGQGVSLMLRNKYGYATSGSTKLDGDDWDNESPSRSVM
ncbi:MAG: hypothetical protein QF675_06165, partial [SAR324 cluster bacterium]|nr:hypothetical protein [SAR324 cluster bacterium]